MTSDVNIENKEVKVVHKAKRHILSTVLFTALIFVAFLLFFAAIWYIETYGETGFDSIVFTLFSNLGGVEKDIIISFVLKVLNPAIITCEISALLLFFKIKKPKIARIKHICAMAISSVLVIVLLVNAGNRVEFFNYVSNLMSQTKIFEEKYVDPRKAEVFFPENERNLIYIFLESIETTFMPRDMGGALDNNIMPELTALAEENINFSHNDGIGGFLTPTGTTWTAAGMVAQSSGVPLKEASGMFKRNEYGKDSFMPGVMSITDILYENGYNQTLLVGSFASFANRDVYYKTHEVEDIYDLSTARKEGRVPKDYYVWWGMEDKYLFDAAKDKLTELSGKGEPFALTMLTVDTHFTAGYVCDLCKNDYKEQYDNVICCSSHQLGNFIDWIKEQSFYENTTIVIAGDHLTMDNDYIKRNVDGGYDRRVYNCIINSAVSTDNCKNRVFTSFDMFPTTLAALNCEIKGNRLGLGTNLFSSTPTLAEEMGYEEFNREVSMNSTYYIKEFMVE